jgi:hypothetical protein
LRPTLGSHALYEENTLKGFNLYADANPFRVAGYLWTCTQGRSPFDKLTATNPGLNDAIHSGLKLNFKN